MQNIRGSDLPETQRHDSLCGNKCIGVWRKGAYMRVVTLSLAIILVDWCCLILKRLRCWFMHVWNLSIYHEDIHGVEVLLCMWFIGKVLTKSVWNNWDGAMKDPSLVTLFVIFLSFVHVTYGTCNITCNKRVIFWIPSGRAWWWQHYPTFSDSNFQLVAWKETT